VQAVDNRAGSNDCLPLSTENGFIRSGYYPESLLPTLRNKGQVSIVFNIRSPTTI
jgi:hypothetical protein